MYKLGPELGRGGFGTVYSGFRISDGIPVAVKFVARGNVAAWGTVSMFISAFLKCTQVVSELAECVVCLGMFVVLACLQFFAHAHSRANSFCKQRLAVGHLVL